MKHGKIWTGLFVFALLALFSGALVIPAIAQQGTNFPVYLPIVMNGNEGGPQPTPSPTITPPTPTVTPTITPTPDPLVPESIFGVNPGVMTDTETLTEALNAGSSWVQSSQPVSWAVVEPAEGQRNWGTLADLEAELQEATRLGLRVILTVDNTPAWARAADSECGPVLTEKLPALTEFLNDLVQRYSAASYQVKYWELWNEPDVAGTEGCWGDPDDSYYGGAAYAGMLKSVYSSMKNADPQAQVLVGGLRLECDPNNQPGGKDCSSSRFLEGILRGGGAGSFDGISFHASDGFAIYDLPWGTAYQYSNYNWRSYWHTTGPVVAAKANFIRGLLDDYGLTDLPLYNTQSALLCASCMDVPVFETAKAGYVAQVYATARSLNLKVNLWENLFGWQNSGFLDSDFTPRPAYHTFQFARQKIGTGDYVGVVSPEDVGGAPGVQGYKFTLPNDRQVWVVWYVSTTEGSHALAFETAPEFAWNVLGQPLDLAEELILTDQPIYLGWAP